MTNKLNNAAPASTKKAVTKPFGSQLVAFEQRMLFDGALAVAADDVVNHRAVAQTPHAEIPADAVDHIADRSSTSVGASVRNFSAPQTLVVIDTTVQNWQQIANAVDPQAQLLILDASKDGLAQIADAMANQQYASVHIVSHGTEGRLLLGNRPITASNINSYSADLARIGAGLSETGDLLLYGCDIGNAASGTNFLQALARATGADVAASSNDTGIATRGGDWVLENAVGAIESKLAFDAARINAVDTILAATPTVTLGGAVTVGGGASNKVLLGESFTMAATFDNTDLLASGFGPYIDVFYSAQGNDGGANPDGIKFNGASYLGAPLTTTFITLTAADIAAGKVAHPYYVDSSGSNLVSIASGFVAGDKLMVVQLPFGSYAAGQPASALSLNGVLSQSADLGVPLNVVARAGFRYGGDPLNNPATDPTILGATSAQAIDPNLYRVKTTYIGPENETSTGENYKRAYRIDVDVAEGQTLSNLQLQDLLPGTLQYAAITGTPTSIGGTSIGAPPPSGWTNVNGVLVSGPATATATPSITTPGGPVSRTFASVTGTAGVTDASMIVEFYVPEFDATSALVLSPTSGDDRSIVNAVQVQASGWTPVDSRDAGTTPPVFTNNAAHTLSAQSISIQKTRVIVVNSGVPTISPGDQLEYSVDVQVSDYFAFGGASNPASLPGSSRLEIIDTLSDGLAFETGSGFAPTLAVNRADGTTENITISAASYVVVTLPDGRQTITVDLAKALQDAGKSQVLVGDQFDTDNTVNTAMTARLVFRANVLDRYRVAPADDDGDPTTISPNSEINEGDRLINNVNISGTVLDRTLNPNAAGLLGERDTSQVRDVVAANAVSLALTSINGNPAGPTPTITPGDKATYCLSYTVPTGDFESFSLSAFLPQPIFSTTDPDANPGTPAVAAFNATPGAFDGSPAIGSYSFRATRGGVALSAAEQQVLISSATTNADANGITFNFTNRDDPLNQPILIEVCFSVQAAATPFADGLFLTALSQSSNSNTANQPNTTQAIIQVLITEPELNIYKAAVQTNVTGAQVFNRNYAPNDPSGLFNLAGDANANPLSGGKLNSAQLDAVGHLTNTLNNVDAGDTVRYAVILENTGSSACGAYDIRIRDELPPGISLADIVPGSLRVVRGDGFVLRAGVDYIGDINTLFDARGIEFVDPLDDPTHPLGIGAARGILADGTVINGRDGANILIVTYDVKLSNSATGPTAIRAGDTYSSNATLFNYASLNNVDTSVATGRPELNYAGGGLTDPGSISTPLPLISKTIVSTSEGFTVGNEVVIGEVITYSVTLTVGEGLTRNAVFTDTLDSGLVFVAIDKITSSTGVTVANTDLTTRTFNGTFNQMTFNFGDVSNVATNSNGTPETITIVYRAVATNVASNQDGKIDANTAAISGTDFGSVTTSQSIRIVEPQVNIVKTADVSNVQIGQTVTYTVTINNPSGVRAHDINIADLVPTGMTFGAFVGTPPAGVSRSGNTITGSNISGATPGSLGVGESVTFQYTAIVSNTAVIGQVYDQNASVSWTSLPGNRVDESPLVSADDTERTGAGGVNDYATADGAPVTVLGTTAALTIVRTSEPSTNPVAGSAPVPATPENAEIVNVAPGEIVRFRMVVQIPEANALGARITTALPPGLRFLNDGTTALAFVADGASGGINSSGANAIAGHDLAGGGNTAGSISGLSPNSLAYLLANGNITGGSGGGGSFLSGDAIVFSLGDLVNTDADANAEYVVIEFNAVVDNAATQVVSGANLATNFIFTSGSYSQGSDTDTLRVVEPKIADVNKQLTGLVASGSTGVATFTTTFSNSGNAQADSVLVRDPFAAYPNITFGALTSVTINGVTQAITNGSAGGLDVLIATLAPNDVVVITYTGNVTDIRQAVPSQDAVVTYTSLSAAGTTLTSGAFTSTTNGERTGNTGDFGGAMNTYRGQDGAGIGVISGRLWDDTPGYPSTTVDNAFAAGENPLGGQVVNLVWDGGDGIFGNGNDVTTSTTTAADGTYLFAGVGVGNYRVQLPTTTVNDAISGPVKVRYDADGGALNQINVTMPEGTKIIDRDFAFVQINQAPVATVPTTVSAPKVILEDNVLSFDGGTGANSAGLITVADEPQNRTSGNVAMLTAGNGVLTIPASFILPAGTSVTGSGTNALVVTGSIVNINAVLAQLQYTPTLNYFGNDTITVKIEDKGAQGDANNDNLPNDPVLDNLSDTKVIYISMTPVNDAPNANPDLRITTEGTPPLTGNAITGATSQGTGGPGAARDTDVDSPVLTVVGVGLPSTTGNLSNGPATIVGTYGSLQLNADGSYTYTQDPAKTAVLVGSTAPVEDVFRYTVTDGTTPVSSTITIRITPLDTPPQANPDTNATVEGATAPVLGNVIIKPTGTNGDQSDTDVDTPAGSLTIFGATAATAATAPGLVAGPAQSALAPSIRGAHGTLILKADGSYSYQVDNTDPAVIALGAGVPPIQDIFVYSVTDLGGNTSNTTLTINITGINNPPVAVDDVRFAPTAPNPVGGIAVQAATTGQAILGAPGGDRADSDPDTGDTIRITGIVAGNTTTVAPGGVTNVIQGLYGTLTIQANGSYSYTPGPGAVALKQGQAAMDQFSYLLSDTGNATDVGLITINLLGVNDPPTARPETINLSRSAPPFAGDSINAGGVSGIDTDPDSDPLAVQGVIRNTVAGPILGATGTPIAGSYGSLVLQANGSYIYTIDPAAVANIPKAGTVSDVYTYSINDGNGGVSTSTITFVISGANTPPAGADKTILVTEDTPINLSPADFGFTDPDAGDTFKDLRIDSLPLSGTLLLNGVPVTAGQIIPFANLSQLQFAPAANANNSNLVANPMFTFSVRDNDMAFDPAPNKITFNINPINDPPVANITTFLIDGGAQAGSPLAQLEISKLINGTVLPAVSDPDVPLDTLSITITSVPAANLGSFYLAGSNSPVLVGTLLTPAQLQQLSYVPNPSITGTPNAQGLVSGGTLGLTVNDGKGGSADGAINILVRPLPPVAQAQPRLPIAPFIPVAFAALDPNIIANPIATQLREAARLRGIDDLRLAPLETIAALDANGYFDRDDTDVPWSGRQKVAGVQFTAEQKAPVLEAVAKDLDCLPEKIKVKPKLNLVKRSVFAQAAGDAPNKAFTEQLKSAQKRFKAPAKLMPKTDTRKAC